MNDEKKSPHLVEGDGFTDITLSREVDIAGAKTKVMRMREPTAGDMESFHAAKGTDASREIIVFANLCETAPDDIRALSLRDYQRLQVAFAGFTD